MAKDARTEQFQRVELFGQPALFTASRLDQASVPDGWYVYDAQSSRTFPYELQTVALQASFDFGGTFLLPTEIRMTNRAKDARKINDKLTKLGYELTLEQFCKEQGMEYPADTRKYLPRPASPEEVGLFYGMTQEQDKNLGTIGHVRMDFGHTGKAFWHTWWARGPQELNSQEFKDELTEVVNELRKSVLKSLKDMRSYCWDHGGSFETGFDQKNYGYVIETENYRYCLRCNPVEGDYQAYLLSA